ncbi:CDP-alcohol phosphatidyltransferase family protein [Clostridiaceae bacterium 35-E11]
MLDTYGRKYVTPLIDTAAKPFIKLNIKANQVTVLALLIGISTGFFIFLQRPITACILLWISGLLDAVDGTVARKEKNMTAWGTLMDITFDRIVEMSVVIGLAIQFPQARMALLILTIAILFSMTIFLTVGALTQQKGIKSFYYQAGLTERTEGFILFTLMILVTNCLVGITYIYAVLVFITALQRMFEARRLFC